MENFIEILMFVGKTLFFSTVLVLLHRIALDTTNITKGSLDSMFLLAYIGLTFWLVTEFAFSKKEG